MGVGYFFERETNRLATFNEQDRLDSGLLKTAAGKYIVIANNGIRERRGKMNLSAAPREYGVIAGGQWEAIARKQDRLDKGLLRVGAVYESIDHLARSGTQIENISSRIVDFFVSGPCKLYRGILGYLSHKA